jgi:exodeoxyribonuclease III
VFVDSSVMPWGASMKVVTWNVNGLRSVAQKGFFSFWEEQNPDVLCLQETKCHPDQLEDALVSPLGWLSYWSAAEKPGYSGTVTYCREKPLSVSHGFGIPKFDAEGRMVVTEFPSFALYNVYFPNGASGPERHAFKAEFLRHFGAHLVARARRGDALMLVGDYNVAYMDEDVYDPVRLGKESGFLPDERAWFRDFLAQGFVDVFRHFHPQEKHRFTWWAYYENARAGNRGWRIDHICVTNNLRERLRSVQILDQQTGSDHCPVCVELEV